MRDVSLFSLQRVSLSIGLADLSGTTSVTSRMKGFRITGEKDVGLVHELGVITSPVAAERAEH